MSDKAPTAVADLSEVLESMRASEERASRAAGGRVSPPLGLAVDPPVDQVDPPVYPLGSTEHSAALLRAKISLEPPQPSSGLKVSQHSLKKEPRQRKFKPAFVQYLDPQPPKRDTSSSESSRHSPTAEPSQAGLTELISSVTGELEEEAKHDNFANSKNLATRSTSRESLHEETATTQHTDESASSSKLSRGISLKDRLHSFAHKQHDSERKESNNNPITTSASNNNSNNRSKVTKEVTPPTSHALIYYQLAQKKVIELVMEVPQIEDYRRETMPTSPTDTVADILHTMKMHPTVFNLQGAVLIQDAYRVVKGFVDSFDLIKYLMELPVPSLMAEYDGDISLKHALSILCTKMTNLSNNDDLLRLSLSHTVADVLKLLGPGGLHRLCLEVERDVFVVSQFDLLYWFVNNRQMFPFLEEEMATAPRLIHRPVITCAGSEAVGLCFVRMLKQQVSGLAILDHRAHLLGQLVAPDVRHFTAENFAQKSRMPVSDFLEEFGASPVIYHSESAKIIKMMKRMLSMGTPRLWIVSKKGEVDGVVTLSSLFDYIHTSLAGPVVTK